MRAARTGIFDSGFFNMADIADNFIHMPDKKWCLVQTKPKKEKYSAQASGAQGIFTYLPLLTKIEIHNRSKREFRLPMFPGYLFACADYDEVALLRRSQEIWNVKILTEIEEEGLLRDLRIVRESELVSQNHELVVNPGLHEGDTVRFKRGPFKGMNVIVAKRENALEVIVNLEFLGRNISMRCDADELIC